MVTTQSTQPSLVDLLPDEETEKPLLKLRLRTLTPLYLGGFHAPTPSWELEPKLLPDEQSASVRGAVRWWLRALLGRIVTHDGARLTVQQVHEIETAVMGGTDWTPDLALSLRLHQSDNPSNRPVPQFSDGGNYSYVGWPFRETDISKPQKRRERGLPPLPQGARQREGGREHWPVDTVVAVSLERAEYSADSPEAIALAAAFWCWANLGAVGARKNRGFGALHAISVENALAAEYLASSVRSLDDIIAHRPNLKRQLSWCPPDDRRNWNEFIQIGLLAACRSVVPLAREFGYRVREIAPRDARALGQPVWPSLADGYWELLLVDSNAASWRGALSTLARHMRAFRCTGRNPADQNRGPSVDYAAVTRAGAAGKSTEIALRHTEFGLPWTWDRIGTVEPATTAVGEALPLGPPPTQQGRRASPLMVRPVLLDDNPARYGLLFLFLDARFLGPSATGVRMTGAALPYAVAVSLPDVDYPTIKEFLVWLESKLPKIVSIPTTLYQP